MKFLSESDALRQLEKIKSEYRSIIQNEYEQNAKNWLTCEKQGACCLDENFVNVNIKKIEAIVIRKKLETFTVQKQEEIYTRIENTIKKYNLEAAENSFMKTFACPLFEKGTGCLIHLMKPVPCIQHACYENRKDLPPDELQIQVEEKIERLNEKTYGKNAGWLPLPLWLNSLKRDATE